MSKGHISIKAVEGMVEGEASALSLQSQLRQAVFNGLAEADIVDIVKGQVKKAKEGDPKAIEFVMKYGLGFGQPSPVNQVNILVTDVETAARIAKGKR